MKRVFFLLAIASLVSCSQATEPHSETLDPAPASASQAIAVESSPSDETVSFEDILAQYQALNQRLETVSYDLQSANAELCPVVDRSAGFTVHTVFDYPDNLQPYARGLLNVGDGLSIRTVREGSPAAEAGLLPGDDLIKVGGTYLPSGRTAQTLYAALTQRAFQEESVEIDLRRGETQASYILTPETLCGYPVNLFFSEQINGHTDGEEVWITSELMRSLPRDEDLALVIAHEMAHAIAGHMDQSPTKALELEADRMALTMLARAGYDFAAAVENWAFAPHPDDEAHPSMTHPTQAERLNHFSQVETEIRDRLARGKTLGF